MNTVVHLCQNFFFPLAFLALLMNKEHVSIRLTCTCSRNLVVHDLLLSVCSSVDLSELAKAAKRKLQSVSAFAD